MWIGIKPGMLRAGEAGHSPYPLVWDRLEQHLRHPSEASSGAGAGRGAWDLSSSHFGESQKRRDFPYSLQRGESAVRRKEGWSGRDCEVLL